MRFESKSKKANVGGERHSWQREEPVQRARGGSGTAMFEEEQEGWCDWSGVSGRKKWGWKSGRLQRWRWSELDYRK